MKIEERHAGNVTVLEVHGRITLGEGDIQLRNRILETIDQGARKILLNLKGVSFIDSAGIGELVAAYTTAKNRNVDLRLCELSKKLRDLLVITRLITVFRVYATEQEALQAFQEG